MIYMGIYPTIPTGGKDRSAIPLSPAREELRIVLLIRLWKSSAMGHIRKAEYIHNRDKRDKGI